jgi:hypothetical protein
VLTFTREGQTGTAGATGVTGPTGPSNPTTVFMADHDASAVGTTLRTASGLVLAVASGNTYGFEFGFLWSTPIASLGLQVGLSFPAAVMIAQAQIQEGSVYRAGALTATSQAVTGVSSAGAGTGFANFAYVIGRAAVTGSGTLSLVYTAQSGAVGVWGQRGSYGRLWIEPG